MHDVLNKLLLINNEIQEKSSKTKIIAVTKTFPLNAVLPLINYGHIDYGENKVQEATEKWTTIKQDFTQKKLFNAQAVREMLSETHQYGE